MPRYICRRCFHEWDSSLIRDGLRCPQCHTRQGVELSKFENAVRKVEATLESFPFPPPNPLDALSTISSVLETITASVEGEFPDPLLPPRVALEIWNRAVERHNQKRQQQGKTG